MNFGKIRGGGGVVAAFQGTRALAFHPWMRNDQFVLVEGKPSPKEKDARSKLEFIEGSKLSLYSETQSLRKLGRKVVAGEYRHVAGRSCES